MSRKVEILVLKQHCHIKMFMHCAACLASMPKGSSPEQWARTQSGWTPWGLQVWCTRCQRDIIHIDFMGQRVGIMGSMLPADAELDPLTESQLDMICMVPNKRADGRLHFTRHTLDEIGKEEPMPNPTEEELNDPMFQMLWQTIRMWDINAPEYYRGYMGANGSHVVVILRAMREAAREVVRAAFKGPRSGVQTPSPAAPEPRGADEAPGAATGTAGGQSEGPGDTPETP